MTQRLKSCSNSINLETIACERYMARLLNREKSSTPNSANSKDRDRSRKQSSVNQNQLSKIKSNVKQQNFPSPKLSQSPTRSGPQYTDDSAFVEVTVKTTNPRQRSRSTTVDREPWAQLLKQQKSGEKVSVFGNFDPLRTLHFLAKELQFQLQAILPDDSNLQQVVADMQYALKRVPPEVASTVHLQQAVDMVPRRTSSKSLSDKPEKLKTSTYEKVTQTPACVSTEDKDKLQRIMEQSTIKLEASCRQMERLCTELKNEKENLEKQLLAERNNVVFYKKRIADLELENNEILNPRLRVLEEEKRKLEFEQQKLENYSLNTPGGGNNKENIGDIGDNTMATIYNSEDPQHPFYICKPHSSFRDLPSGDLDTSTLLQEVPDDYFSGRPTKDKKPANSLDTMPLIEKLDSHASIRSLFNDVKKTAFAVANTPSRVQSRYNIVEGRH
ncbi:uncharacterized protein isoform X2 [Leptinotarsa decemlineata]|uniref:uncharacterized protein isoform X2 n=1 Tax=Leptinotarsa decemlineata TaxID=7539 RepID=UPI003D303E92